MISVGCSAPEVLVWVLASSDVLLLFEFNALHLSLILLRRFLHVLDRHSGDATLPVDFELLIPIAHRITFHGLAVIIASLIPLALSGIWDAALLKLAAVLVLHKLIHNRITSFHIFVILLLQILDDLWINFLRDWIRKRSKILLADFLESQGKSLLDSLLENLLNRLHFNFLVRNLLFSGLEVFGTNGRTSFGTSRLSLFVIFLQLFLRIKPQMAVNIHGFIRIILIGKVCNRRLEVGSLLARSYGIED